MGLRVTSIVTDRLELRPLVPEDADEMASALGDERLHDFTGGHPLPPEQLRTRYERLAGGWSADGAEQWCNWIIRVQPSGDAVGFVEATATDAAQAATIAWVVGVPWQGRGYAAEAAIAVVGWLAAAGVRTIEAHIHADHQASGRVAARAGLVPSTDMVEGEVVWRRPAEP
jgi:RimJ/RimL family protein N-acetyltransferase